MYTELYLYTDSVVEQILFELLGFLILSNAIEQILFEMLGFLMLSYFDKIDMFVEKYYS